MRKLLRNNNFWKGWLAASLLSACFLFVIAACVPVPDPVPTPTEQEVANCESAFNRLAIERPEADRDFFALRPFRAEQARAADRAEGLHAAAVRPEDADELLTS